MRRDITRFVLLGLFVLAGALPCTSQQVSVDTLAAGGKLAIPREEALRLQAGIGQLLIVNVDGFGYAGPLALEPGFAPMVQRLQIGGVIPHYGSTSYERIRLTNRSLAGLTDLPLLICCDIVKLKGPSRTVSFGDGYVGGFLGKFRRLPDEQLRKLARLNAYAFAALGVNVSLGPTVDTSTGDRRTEERAQMAVDELKAFGIQVVLKHFPYLPTGQTSTMSHPTRRSPCPRRKSALPCSTILRATRTS